MTLTFNPLRAMIMTYTCAKVQCQWSVGSEDRVEKTDEWTNIQTQAIALSAVLVWSVNIAVIQKHCKHNTTTLCISKY